MPTVNPGAKVLVTGANGFIPMWTVARLLEKGYAVRAAVRSAEKGRHLEEYFKKYEGKLELVVVPDITVEGAFDEAVKGVEGIEHMASPFIMGLEDPEDYIRPAIDGTLGILNSALKHSTSLKRVVITSSCGSVFTIQDTPRTFSEADWNEQSIQVTKEKGRDADAASKYCASKTLAEKASVEWYEKHKGEVGWDTTWILPPFAFGPPIQEIPGNSPEKLNTSMKPWYDTVIANVPGVREALAWSNSWADVRDLAEAHVLALEKEAAGGERIIVSQGSFVWQEWLDVANSLKEAGVYSGKELPKGFPDINESKVYMTNYDTSKEKRILGVKYRTMKETTRDILEDFRRRGW
ncbi:hypothetical protein NMY22_g10117 [Coprinellus aureogranulatus]|nr:hypothetical protein NMY22_g10117 [Coprinellus aureogranulatus]